MTFNRTYIKPTTLPTTFKEARKLKESLAPINASMAYEAVVAAPLCRSPPIQYGEPLDPNSYSMFTNTQPTPLTSRFFSEENINYIRTTAPNMIYKKYGLQLAPQPYKATKMFMMLIFNDVGCDISNVNNVDRNFSILNKYVLEELEKRLVKNMKLQAGYLEFSRNLENGKILSRGQYTNKMDKSLSTDLYFGKSQSL